MYIIVTITCKCTIHRPNLKHNICIIQRGWETFFINFQLNDYFCGHSYYINVENERQLYQWVNYAYTMLFSAATGTFLYIYLHVYINLNS